MGGKRHRVARDSLEFAGHEQPQFLQLRQNPPRRSRLSEFDCGARVGPAELSVGPANPATPQGITRFT